MPLQDGTLLYYPDLRPCDPIHLRGHEGCGLSIEQDRTCKSIT